MKIGSKLFALVLASVLICTVAATNLQQVTAPTGCSGCTEFKKLTHEFEKNVINTVDDPNISPQPQVRELLQAYDQDVQRIFIGEPNIDQLKTLLQSYEQKVTSLFDAPPPDGDKQLIKDFRVLTHDFIGGAVASIFYAATHNND